MLSRLSWFEATHRANRTIEHRGVRIRKGTGLYLRWAARLRRETRLYLIDYRGRQVTVLAGWVDRIKTGQR